MAEVINITLTLTMDEAKAVFKALGEMPGAAVYGSVVLANAGSAVYNELTPIVEENE